MAHEQAVVHVVDDDEAVRDAIILLLRSVGLTASGYADAAEFLDAVDPLAPGCVVLDVRMPGMSGMDLQKHLNDAGSSLPIIFVTGHGDVPMAVQAMREGAEEFLQKPFREQDLLDKVNRVLALDAQHRHDRESAAAMRARLADLTPREREVLEQLVDGRVTKQIAQAMSLSPRTVEVHRAHIMEKTGARSVGELIKLVMQSA